MERKRIATHKGLTCNRRFSFRAPRAMFLASRPFMFFQKIAVDINTPAAIANAFPFRGTDWIAARDGEAPESSPGQVRQSGIATALESRGITHLVYSGRLSESKYVNRIWNATRCYCSSAKSPAIFGAVMFLPWIFYAASVCEFQVRAGNLESFRAKPANPDSR